jgi:hypothetical protein
MDYIFKDWEKKLSNFADSVEKDLNEIRQCKAEIQQMKLEMEVERQKGRYVRDDHRLVLSAPEIVIGNVDRNGTLFPGGSTIVVRGTDVGVQAAGEGGLLEMRAAGIRQIAEDPGIDGYEHVVYNRSEVVSQARNIIIQSDETTDAFFAPTLPTGGSGVRIHADQKVDIEAAMTAESREELLGDMTKGAENMQKLLKEQANKQKSGLQSSIEEITKLIEKKEKLAEDYTAVRTNAADIQSLDQQIRELSSSIANNIYGYTEVLSQLAEANRQAKSFKAQKETVVKGKDFKTKPTGAAVAITGEYISLVSADGEGNLRDNEGSGIEMKANTVDIASVEEDGKLKKEGQVSITAKNIGMTTAGETGQEYEDGVLKTATYTAEGDFTLRSKNITIEAVDYEVADKELKEKALTQGGKISIRAEKTNLSAVDTEGKAAGTISLNAKDVSLKAMDTDKESHDEKEPAQGGKVQLLAENMLLGEKDKSKQLQMVSEAISLAADKELKAQQGEEKAVIKLSDEKMAVTASEFSVKAKTAIEGDTQIKGETKIKGNTEVDGSTKVSGDSEVKGGIKSPKATIDNIEAKSSLKSPNISDGIATK